ncbi:hypothetical protein CIPAW_05G039900 [Carya illinoinensis]|uniref:Uncharacterized protein n=1 Tax=Carya illinoinensis TaxID=32201 RepID=A0A8T1QEB6_CARIL|nr:hypothetical protein CIPAW_05G039900 [Carya illinoinensis]
MAYVLVAEKWKLLGQSAEKTGEPEAQFSLVYFGFLNLSFFFSHLISLPYGKRHFLIDPVYIHSEVYFFDSFIYSPPLCFFFNFSFFCCSHQ